MNDRITAAAAELLAAIDRRWEGETDRKRANGVSPRMEEAIAELREALAAQSLHNEPDIDA